MEPSDMATAGEDLDRFTTFVRQRLGSGGPHLSLDDLFDLWRTENPTESSYAENVAAVNAAIADFRNGDRGTPAGEHSAQLRHQFGIVAE